MKFTKNRKNSSDDKKTLRFNILMEFDQVEKNELFFINTKELSAQEFTNFTELEKYQMEYISKYTPEIWKGYNVLNPVEEIKNYDTGEQDK